MIELEAMACDNEVTVRTYAVRQTEGLSKTILNGFGFGGGFYLRKEVFCELFLYKPTRW